MIPAIYTRYSSDNQRESSIEDQARNCLGYCQREGWGEPIVYRDAALSGSRSDRPEYQSMLADAQARRFDVLLVDDLSRLSRDNLETERVVRLLKFWGVRLIGVSDGVDTDQKGYRVQTGLRGIMNSLYLDDLAEKTHRGLKGQALAGQSAGGRSYGYTSRPIIEHGDIIGYQKQIDDTEAEWVRYIFRRFAEGASPRTIADELNRQGVASPRGSTWAHSAIYGDNKRGLGMLNNPLYIGQQIWNRSKWVKDPLTGKRRRQERPTEEWVIQDSPELAIVDQDTWSRVKARQAAQTERTTKRRTGRPGHSGGAGKSKYILSGLLKCGCCGGNYIIIGKDYYGCATNKDRGESVCNNRVRVRKPVAERVLLQAIRDDLLSDDAYNLFIAELTRLAEELAPDTRQMEKSLVAARKEAENVMNAIRQGIITPSTKKALEDAERRQQELQQEIAQAKQHRPLTMIPKARETWKHLVADIGNLQDIQKARLAVRDILGEITLHPHEDGYLEAEMNQGLHLETLSSMVLVAGAGFEHHLTSIRIRLPGAKMRRGLP